MFATTLRRSFGTLIFPMCVCARARVCVCGNIATRDERKRKYGPFDNFKLLEILKQKLKVSLRSGRVAREIFANYINFNRANV